MKIGIDISQIVYGTGVSTYTKNLVKNLLAIDKENEYILFGGSLRRRSELNAFLDSLQVTDPEGSLTRRGQSFKSRVLPIPPTVTDIVWNRLHIFPIEWLIGKIDVFHSSDWSQPPSRAFKVTTVHDLVPIKYPALSHPRIVSAHKNRLTWVKKEGDRIIVPSETTKVDLNQMGFELGMIVVVPEAPDPIFKPEKKNKVDEVKKKYNIQGNYLMAVGITPRKNTKRIIEAHERIKKKYGLKLVIIGHPFMNIKPKRGVIILREVTFEELPALYSGAEALVYPSLYEGFGLPVLEAFACRTPVVTSNLGSLKEIAESASVLVDPNSVKSISNGIENAINNRDILISKGVKRVKKFNWQKVAIETLKIYARSK